MRSKNPTRPAPAIAGKPPLAAPAWLRPATLVLAALVLVAWFSPPVADTDAWWHLKTGQYIVQQHRLPVPDPFAYTTYKAGQSYAGEEITRYFNLTHEWLAQAALYGAYAAGGFTGLVLMRAIMLTLFCGLVALMAYRRSGSIYRAIGAALATALVARAFAADRPQLFTYIFVLVTIYLLDTRRRLWLLPPMFLIWANCHAGFFLGWVMVGIYCAESLYLRWRGKPLAEERTMWLAGISAILVSGLNPNGFRIVQVMRSYRSSPMQSQIWEWQYPKFWEVTPFSVLLFGAVLVLLLNRRRVRPVDWLLLLVFGASGLLAFRNIIFSAVAGSILIAAYFPEWKNKLEASAWVQVAVLFAAAFLAAHGQPLAAAVSLGIALLVWMGKAPVLAEFAFAVMLFTYFAAFVITERAFQFRASNIVPAEAADFLLQHHIQGRMFNTYTQGGYLIWRLWPQMQVFVDGRALNEQVFNDTRRIGMNADEVGGKSGEELLKEYGVDIIVMDGFEPVSGMANYLPAALADPKQTEWKLVYRDVHDVIYMRHPPPDVPVLNTFDALAGMEEQCQYQVDHDSPACTKGMIDVFSRIGDQARLRKWMSIYQSAHVEDKFTRF
jgi:hypothetical protein